MGNCENYDDPLVLPLKCPQSSVGLIFQVVCHARNYQEKSVNVQCTLTNLLSGQDVCVSPIVCQSPMFFMLPNMGVLWIPRTM